MTTATLERTEELRKATVSVPVNPNLYEVEGFHQNATTVGPVTHVPMPLHRDGLLARMAKGVLDFYLSLSGPPMSERDRTRRDIAKWEFEWKYQSCCN